MCEPITILRLRPARRRARGAAAARSVWTPLSDAWWLLPIVGCEGPP